MAKDTLGAVTKSDCESGSQEDAEWEIVLEGLSKGRLLSALQVQCLSQLILHFWMLWRLRVQTRQQQENL